MPIVFACPCGTNLKAKPEDSGKRTRCPRCGKVLTIPDGSDPVTAVASSKATSSGDPNAIAVDDLAWPTIDDHAHSEPASSHDVPVAERPETTSIQVDSAVADRPHHDPLDDARPTDGTHQYKVLTPKDYGLTGKFNPSKLEEALNTLAHKGWGVRTASVLRIHSHSGDHDELILILER